MSDVMKWLEEVKTNQRRLHAHRVQTVLTTEVPQHILAKKEIADALCEGGDGYVKNELGFFFKERLVNRLMYLSYLHGRDEIDQKSFALGCMSAIEKIKQFAENINNE